MCIDARRASDVSTCILFDEVVCSSAAAAAADLVLWLHNSEHVVRTFVFRVQTRKDRPKKTLNKG